MNDKRYQIYLGALLHDIGKFVYRSQATKPGDNHQKLGEEFIREYLGKIEIAKSDIEKIIAESKHHEIPTYCRIADRIASQERDKEDNKQARRPLVSILSDIKISAHHKNKSGIYYYVPETISSYNIFPELDKTTNNTDKWNYDENLSIAQHQNLLNKFKEEFKHLNKIKDYNSLTFTLYHLLFKYISRISSAGFGSKPDISLFDHNRATAGLTNCLTYLLEEKDLDKYKAGVPDKEFYFIKGDLAGIQKFIYSDIRLDQTQGSKGLAKKLKGRSFYVSLLTDFIAGMFIKELEIAEANLLYSGGGHFNIVAPYYKDIDEKIENFTKHINLILLNKIGSRLCLVIGKTKTDNTLYINTGEVINKANYELGKAKNKRHKSYLEDIFYNKAQKVKENFKDDEKIGKLLPYSDYLIEIESNKEVDFSDDNNIIASFEDMNSYFFMIKNHEDNKTKEYDYLYNFFKQRKNKIKSAKLLKINDSNFLDYADKLNNDFKFPISYGFKFIGNYAPQNEKYDLLEFSEISCLDNNINEKLNYPQLAIIRLDVDNLGGIFGFGLGHKVSFSRVATLSRELDVFFCGYINELAKKYKLYITYSGGDDAFLIGSWLNILHFAKEFYEKFKEFTCNNSDITFSAGIFMCNEHYPIAKFAEKTAELEETSKNYEKDGKQKNAVTVFDHTLSWDNYCAMIDFSEKLLSYTKTQEVKDKNKLARSLVHRLLRIIKSSIKRNGKVDIEKLQRNVAQLHYLFARHGFDATKIEQAKEGLVKDVISVILKVFSKEDIIKDYLIPTNYVILKTRKINK